MNPATRELVLLERAGTFIKQVERNLAELS